MKKIIRNILDKIFRTAVLNDINYKLDRLDSNILDIKTLMMGSSQAKYSLETNHRFAFSSQDYLKPKGSKDDFTRSPFFVGKLNIMFGRPISYLDIGCANGGLVNDFIIQGNEAIGIEGSDFGFTTKQDHWRVLPQNLFNADVTKPFFVTKDSKPHKFDVIGAWEVLEHIKEEDLGFFLQNIRNHLSEKSIFMASIAQFPVSDPVTGEEWHVTIKSKDWWFSFFKDHGFVPQEIPKNFPFPRGNGNPSVNDWDVKQNPNLGFHVFLGLKN